MGSAVFKTVERPPGAEPSTTGNARSSSSFTCGSFLVTTRISAGFREPRKVRPEVRLGPIGRGAVLALRRSSSRRKEPELASDREQEPVQEQEPIQGQEPAHETKVVPSTRLIESSNDESVRKGTDLFDVAPPPPTDASPEDLMASLVPQKIAEPKEQASSE